MTDSSPAANAVIGTAAASSSCGRPAGRHVHQHSTSCAMASRSNGFTRGLNRHRGLFARAPTLPAGAYKLHWSVRTMTGADATQGDILPSRWKDQP